MATTHFLLSPDISWRYVAKRHKELWMQGARLKSGAGVRVIVSCTLKERNAATTNISGIAVVMPWNFRVSPGLIEKDEGNIGLLLLPASNPPQILWPRHSRLLPINHQKRSLSDYTPNLKDMKRT